MRKRFKFIAVCLFVTLTVVAIVAIGLGRGVTFRSNTLIGTIEMQVTPAAPAHVE